MTRVPFTQNHRWHLPLLLLVFCCSFFINNGAIFADIMESRNIITAREMVYDHNWLVPTMNGELRLEKPPLPTWIAAITEMISPDNLPLQRAMAGFAAVMLVLFFLSLIAERELRQNTYIFNCFIIYDLCHYFFLPANSYGSSLFRSLGNRHASRTFSSPRSCIVRRSRPIPSPP